MKVNPYILLGLAASLILIPGLVLAQSTDAETVIITLTGQNYKRTVAGAISTECDPVQRPVQWHDPPWGNWGVDSNYGTRTDKDQFRGWSHQDGPTTKRQWNSCTLGNPDFAAPNCDYYNDNDCWTQKTVPLLAIVTHGVMSYRHSSTSCPTPGTVGNDPGQGCLVLEGTQASQTNNHMSLFELDVKGTTRLKDCTSPAPSLPFETAPTTLARSRSLNLSL